MAWAYSQSSGDLSFAGAHVATGYSGHDEGRNNPDMQDVRAVGPIPKGYWHMTGIENGTHTGPFTIILDPEPTTETFGRSLFRIHGDNATHDASNGCIILGPDVRHKIWGSGDHLL